MASDDAVYCALLLFSIPVGHVIKSAQGYHKKQLISGGVGASVVILVSGIHCLHSLFTTLVNIAIVTCLSPKISHIVSFIWCFGYIVFFRTTHFFGLPPAPPHTNAVQLLLTLKMVGLAFEIHDTHKNKTNAQKCPEDVSLKLKNEYQNISPSVLDMFMYACCYIGILTGPYYKYRTYHDMLSEKNTRNIDTLKPTIDKMKWVPLYACGFLVASTFFTVNYARTDEFYEEPFWFRLLYMVPVFFIFRMRFYVAWVTAEAMCVTAGLGAYPAASRSRVAQGPTDFKALKNCELQAPEGVAYDFETIRNIDTYYCELAPTIREGVRGWNMTVQSWLANHIYKRLSFKSGPLKVAITMTVSAFWHGIHPGYYLSFLTVPISMVAEDTMARAFRDNRPIRQQLIFDWVCWFWKMRLFDYMCMSFLLLTLTDTLSYWASIYFAGHVVVVCFISIGLYFRPRREEKEASKEKRDAPSGREGSVSEAPAVTNKEKTQ